MTPLQIGASAAAILAGRREGDPLRTWTPYAQQSAFLASGADEAWFLGANRTGKSDALAAWLASMARFGAPTPDAPRGPARNLWAVSLTREMSRDILQPKLFDNGYVAPGQHPPFIPAHEIAHWSETSQVLRLKNGSMIGFKSCDQGRERFQGKALDGVGFDEAPPKGVYTESIIRIEAGRKLWVRGACTLLPPDGVTGGVSWLFGEKIKPWTAGQRNLQRCELFGAAIYDNPYILPGEIERLEAMYAPNSVDRRIRMQGEWLPDMAGTRAYPAFDARIHVNPVLTRESVEFRWPLLLGFDSNVAPLAAVLWQQTATGYRQVDEFCIETGGIPAFCAEFRHRYPGHGAALRIYGDATSTFKKAQTAKSDYELLVAELSALPYPVEVYVPNRNPPIRDRLNAMNYLLQGRGGQVRLEVAPHCTETVDDFEQVLRSKDGAIKKVHDRKDPYYRRTGWTDAAGYIVSYLEPVSTQTASQERRGFRIASPRYFG